MRLIICLFYIVTAAILKAEEIDSLFSEGYDRYKEKLFHFEDMFAYYDMDSNFVFIPYGKEEIQVIKIMDNGNSIKKGTYNIKKNIWVHPLSKDYIVNISNNLFRESSSDGFIWYTFTYDLEGNMKYIDIYEKKILTEYSEAYSTSIEFNSQGIGIRLIMTL